MTSPQVWKRQRVANTADLRRRSVPRLPSGSLLPSGIPRPSHCFARHKSGRRTVEATQNWSPHHGIAVPRRAESTEICRGFCPPHSICARALSRIVTRGGWTSNVHSIGPIEPAIHKVEDRVPRKSYTLLPPITTLSHGMFLRGFPCLDKLPAAEARTACAGVIHKTTLVCSTYNPRRKFLLSFLSKPISISLTLINVCAFAC